VTTRFGLEVVVRGEHRELLVNADAAALRRDLGPVPWCALEILALAARPDHEGRLVASVNARDLARRLGVGRDAATSALSALRRHGLVISDERRGARGRFAGTELVVELPMEAPAGQRKRRVPRPMSEPTLFDKPIPTSDDPTARSDAQPRPVTTDDHADTRTHGQASPTSLPPITHTLALRMPGDAGGASC
jgi:DNA-binding transcriptional ArsR family regulator